MAATFTSFGPGYGMGWPVPYPNPDYDSRSTILELTREIIRGVARSGNAVIVGRGAAVLLQEQPKAVHVFLYASDSARAATVMARETISEVVARRQMHEVDASRAAYLREVYQTDWREPQQYALQLNTGSLGYARTTEIILAAAA
jgi:cytidylate kinase